MTKAFILFTISLFTFSMSAQTNTITPPFLKAGDTVAILATARKHIVKTMQPTIDLLESWGLKVVIGNTIGLEQNQLAGSDEERTADLQLQLDNPSIKAIWCARGGYGTVRVVDKIDFSKFLSHPKWLVGFSDVTVLHNHLNTMGYKSIHGIMPISLAKATPEAIETLRKALFGEKLSYEIEAHPMNKKGKATAELVGGNLSILYSLLGSPSAIECKDKILYIEDLDEYLYHIDRMMMNLKRNGCLESLKGIIVGSMTEMKDNDIPWGKNALEIVKEITQELSVPMIFNFPAGHIHDNRALILGNQVTIEVTEDCSKVVFE